ncbi:MAG: GYF domain-containing protein [Myxococcales bacterium]
MKIVCDSCGAKYSIADEKVAGKVFKIRCKKCSAVIVVKGDNQEEGDEATRVYDYGAEAVWHVVVGGDQQGPLAPRQLGEMLAEGKIDWEAYVWREGMDGWQPAKDVETLVSAIMQDAEGAPSPQAAQPAQSQLFGGSSDMGADPFASNDDGGLSGVMGQSAAASSSGGGGGGDLFARSARSPFAGSVDDDEPMSNGHRGSPHVSEAESMTGQRNENSVLFSLSNLQALATGSGSTAAAPKAKAGMAQGEGSGLIDIRALASATQAVSSTASNGSSREKVEDLMSVGAAGTGFSAAAFAAPVAVDKGDNSKLLLGGMAGAILLLGAAVGYLVLRSPAPADPMAQAPVAAQPALGAALPAASAAATAPTPSAPVAEAAAAPTAEAPSKASADEESDREEKSGGSHRSKRGSSGSSGESTASASKPEKASDPAPAPAEKAPAKQSSADSSIDDLLSGALGGKAKPKPAAPAASESLAPTPSRDEVMAAMKSVTPKVTACGDGSGGVAKAKVTVAGATGRVTSVEVDGPAQSCVTKEVSKAKFPKFANSSFNFTYPFKL